MTDSATTHLPPHHARVVIADHGPYEVSGAPALTTRMPVHNAQGEAIDWSIGSDRAVGASYFLCRCGHSGNKPFCDGTHSKIGFDGTCTAERGPAATRRKVYQGAGITMTDDESLCAGYEYCDRNGGVWREIAATSDPAVRRQLEQRIAQCPSGRLQYTLAGKPEPEESYYPPTIAAIPDGPLWLLGGVPAQTHDGFTYEVRNRQLLCRCGGSQNKPFCDGTHRLVGFKAP